MKYRVTVKWSPNSQTTAFEYSQIHELDERIGVYDIGETINRGKGILHSLHQEARTTEGYFHQRLVKVEEL